MTLFDSPPGGRAEEATGDGDYAAAVYAAAVERRAGESWTGPAP